MRYLDRLHPVSAFLYFLTLLLVAMLTMHPIAVGISYLGAVTLLGTLIGIRRLLASLAYSLPLMLLIALANPIFVHRGATVLFFLNGNPVTRESIVYGAVASVLLLSVFYWCRCYTEIFSGEKFIYLFGRAVPRLSLVLSMTIALLPRMKRRMREIDDAQRALGVYATEAWSDRLRARLRVLSILLTSTLEGSVETADSMRARGYGLKGRTSLSHYRFRMSDGIFLAVTLLLGVADTLLILSGVGAFDYYPRLSAVFGEPLSWLLYVLLAVLAGAAIFMEIKETVVWRILRSRI